VLVPASKKNPPPYRLRISSRAKYMRLRILPGGSLELVLPPHVALAEGEAFIQSRAGWIEQARRRMAAQRSDDQRACRDLPRFLALQAVGEEWRIDYVASLSPTVVLKEGAEGVLHIAGAEEEKPALRGLLREWLKRRARSVLPEWLDEMEWRTGLEYQRVTVRLQKRRWGSCSSRHNISLNAKLLFLPREQVDYVLLHELCHTRELNHSPAFWSLVQSYMPHARELDRALRDADRHLPRWIHCD